jgi:uncharacterized delta-60 repeat protein
MRRPIPSLAFVTLAAVAVALEAPATAGAGQLDPTFGDNGKVVTDLGGGDGITASLALGSKVVAVGESSGDVAVARYLGDGSLDDRFGGDGVALTDLGSDIDTAADVALAWSKAYLVIAHGIRTGGGGSQFNQFFLLRYTREGELDPRFGQDGVLTLDRRLFGRAMMVQPDGKVVIAGDVAGGTKFMVERLLRNGAPDPTFGGGDGKIVTGFGVDLQSHASDVLLQPDGRILVVGWSYVHSSTRSKLTMARYRPSGRLDRTFGTRGKTFWKTSEWFAVGAALESTGRIVVASSKTWGRSLGCGLADSADLLLGFDPHGRLDTRFGRNGRALVPATVVSAVTVQPDDRVMVVGYGCPSSRLVVAAARYTADGESDLGFGHHGVSLTPVGRNSLASSVSTGPRGKTVAAGQTLNRNFDYVDFALVRLLA